MFLALIVSSKANSASKSHSVLNKNSRGAPSKSSSEDRNSQDSDSTDNSVVASKISKKIGTKNQVILHSKKNSKTDVSASDDNKSEPCEQR